MRRMRSSSTRSQEKEIHAEAMMLSHVFDNRIVD